MNGIDFTALGTGLTHTAIKVGLTLVVGLILIKCLMALVRKALKKSRLEKAAHTLILSLCSTALYGLLIIALVKSLGIDVTGVVALASVLTLAVSLAMQNMLTNVVGGFTLLYNHPFHSGDVVEIAGQTGTVEEINMAYTKLTTPDNKVISLPNSAVVGSQIVNFSTSENRRVDFSVSASYDAPTATVLEALRQAADLPQVLQDPAPFAAISKYGDSAIDYVLRVWVKNPDYWDVYFEINNRIRDSFQNAGVEMTYPHLNVHLDK